VTSTDGKTSTPRRYNGSMRVTCESRSRCADATSCSRSRTRQRPPLDTLVPDQGERESATTSTTACCRRCGSASFPGGDAITETNHAVAFDLMSGTTDVSMIGTAFVDLLDSEISIDVTLGTLVDGGSVALQLFATDLDVAAVHRSQGRESAWRSTLASRSNC